ncbi:MAG: PD40 domain-containing protein [Bacteroidetes bacterium]|nr:PD40 domain-containing protein [Bacteroidota bacterium]
MQWGNHFLLICFSAIFLFSNLSLRANEKGDRRLNLFEDSTKKDTTKYVKYKDLPLKPTRKISYSTKEGSWMSLDVSPDGQTIVFDLMGDLYTIPITGGHATSITKGLSYDVHPRYSPDGKKILFVSDRSGADNVWYIDFEKGDTVQLTKEVNQYFPSACWTPDGDYIIYAKGRRNIKLYMVHRKGGGGAQLVDGPAYLKAIDPAVSADGRYVYYSQRRNAWNYNAMLPQYQIGVYDRDNAKTNNITSRYGSGFTPVLSKDGKWMVYGSRFEDKTGLVIRDLKTGDEKWLAYPVQRDEQESIAPMGVLPGMSFTPDSKALIASYGGKFYRIPIDGGAITEIPFTANVELELGPKLEFKYPVSDTAYQQSTQIRDAVPSPDGKKLAFTVLNRLYVMDYPNGTPKRVTNNDFTEAQPAWSPDGNSIAFSTWNADGGNIYKIIFGVKKNSIQKLTTEPGLYQNLIFNLTGDRIAFIRSSKRVFKEAYGPGYNGNEDDICWIPANGGSINVIDKSMGRFNPHFVKGQNDRIYLNNGEGYLISMKWDGTDEKKLAHVSGITVFGSTPTKYGRPDPSKMQCIVAETEDEDREREMVKPSDASFITMSPEGDRAIAEINNNIYVVTVPKTGKTANISVADASNAEFPARQLTEIGGEFPSWQLDGKTVHWSLGSAHFTYDVDKAQAFDDSVVEAKKLQAKKSADSIARLNADSTLKKSADSLKKITDSLKAKDTTAKKSVKKEEPKFKASESDVKVFFKKDMPKGSILFKNARIITMKGEEVIESGDLLVENNRIKAIGKSGTINAPSGAQIMDMSGKTITPGFVDPHSHMWPNWGMHKNQIWIYAINLAYGVTTTRDPQTATTDVLTYGDMVDAGEMIGPRIYSTGPGVGYWFYNVKDSTQAENILEQYSKYFHTKYIKMYLTGNRKQREWIIEAARHQQLMPTTEGGLDFKLNMTNMLDGYPGHEHALPIYPLYSDVFKAISQAHMMVTPTLIVSYGGPFAENYFWETENPYHDPKVQHFMAYEELASKTRRVQGWFMPEEQVFPKHAKNMKALVEAGGMVGVGSHGEFQGLGYHWELWALQSGGMRNIDALKCATILGAEGLGLDKDLGSIEVGKLADLVIMEKNPLENIRNSNTIQYVMKNGRLYDGNTADEIYPQKRVLNNAEWSFDKPGNTTGIKE